MLARGVGRDDSRPGRQVHSVNDVLEAAILADLRKPGEELVLAMEAAVRIVADVVGIIELVGGDVLVRDSEPAREPFAIALVRFRE
jgi:hypothetical protein